jgi:hypothetical protein
VGHTLELRLCELRENTTWQLHASVEGADKGSYGERVSQPWLSEDSVVLSEVVLNGSRVPSGNQTASDTYIFVSAVLSCLFLKSYRVCSLPFCTSCIRRISQHFHDRSCRSA